MGAALCCRPGEVTCRRRHYERAGGSPLEDVLESYSDYFELFAGFREFVDFFHFQDLVSADYSRVEFLLPFDGFERSGVPSSLDEYAACREATLAFEEARGQRMAAFARAHGLQPQGQV